jgi:hypothetical protein
MEAVTRALAMTDDRELADGLCTGNMLVADEHMQMIVDILDIELWVHLPSGAEATYRPHGDMETGGSSDVEIVEPIDEEAHRRSRLDLAREDCELCTFAFKCGLHASSAAGTAQASSAGTSSPAGAVQGRVRVRIRTKTSDPEWEAKAAALAVGRNAHRGVPRAKGKPSRRICSRCGAGGHRRDGGKCPLNSDDKGAQQRPRWARPKRGPIVRSIRSRGHKLWRGASRLPRVVEPWDPPYTREESPGRAKRQRMDRRASTDLIEMIVNGQTRIRGSMIKLGLLHDWRGERCLACVLGKYGYFSKTNPNMLRCGKRNCKSKVCETYASPYADTILSDAKCVALAGAYAARLTPTMASVLLRISRTVITRYWAYFRAAEACKGLGVASRFQSCLHPLKT